MAATIKSLRGAVQFGIVNGKRNMIVELGTLDDLFRLNDELLRACIRFTKNAECTCADLGGDGFICDVCEARAAITKAEGA